MRFSAHKFKRAVQAWQVEGIACGEHRTQADVAAANDVSPTTITAWKQGTTTPPAWRWPKIAASIGRTVDDLTNGRA